MSFCPEVMQESVQWMSRETWRLSSHQDHKWKSKHIASDLTFAVSLGLTEQTALIRPQTHTYKHILYYHYNTKSSNRSTAAVAVIGLSFQTFSLCPTAPQNKVNTCTQTQLDKWNQYLWQTQKHLEQLIVILMILLFFTLINWVNKT